MDLENGKEHEFQDAEIIAKQNKKRMQKSSMMILFFLL